MSETRLMTYAELGEAIGRSEIAARSVAIRKRWRRVLGNDGKARVAVPVEPLERLQAKAEARAVEQPEPEPVEQPDTQPDDRQPEPHAWLTSRSLRSVGERSARSDRDDCCCWP